MFLLRCQDISGHCIYDALGRSIVQLETLDKMRRAMYLHGMLEFMTKEELQKSRIPVLVAWSERYNDQTSPLGKGTNQGLKYATLLSQVRARTKTECVHDERSYSWVQRIVGGYRQKWKCVKCMEVGDERFFEGVASGAN